MKRFQTLLLCLAASVALADGQPFERYQTIIDRKPFGPEPVNFDPEALPGSTAGSAGSEEMTPAQMSAEAQQIAAKVRVSMLNVTPAGVVKVGFTDSSANPNENYYLAVGASQNGWTVKNADPKAESVTLEKDGVEVTLKIGEATGGKDAKGGQSKRRHAAASPAPAARPLIASGRAAEGATAADKGRSIGSIARLRQQRMERAAKEREEAERKREAAAAAEAERKEREAALAAEKQRSEEEQQRMRDQLNNLTEAMKQMRKQKEDSANANEEGQGETDNAE